MTPRPRTAAVHRCTCRAALEVSQKRLRMVGHYHAIRAGLAKRKERLLRRRQRGEEVTEEELRLCEEEGEGEGGRPFSVDDVPLAPLPEDRVWRHLPTATPRGWKRAGEEEEEGSVKMQKREEEEGSVKMQRGEEKEESVKMQRGEEKEEEEEEEEGSVKMQREEEKEEEESVKMQRGEEKEEEEESVKMQRGEEKEEEEEEKEEESVKMQRGEEKEEESVKMQRGEEKEDPRQRLRARVFEELWQRGHHVTVSTAKMGGDFLLYPGDPVRYHASHIVVLAMDEVELAAYDLCALLRLANSVKKVVVLASESADCSELLFTTMAWAGVG